MTSRRRDDQDGSFEYWWTFKTFFLFEKNQSSLQFPLAVSSSFGSSVPREEKKPDH